MPRPEVRVIPNAAFSGRGHLKTQTDNRRISGRTSGTFKRTINHRPNRRVLNTVRGFISFTSYAFALFCFSTAFAKTLDLTIPLGDLNDSQTRPPEFQAGVMPSLKQQLLEDLKFLGTRMGDSSSDTFYEIFDLKTFDGPRLLDFFNHRVRKIAFDSSPDDPSLIAYIKTNEDPSVMWLKASYTTFDMPQVFRISLLLHESRHTEIDGAFWLHLDCPTPFLDDEGREVIGALSGEKLEGRRACDWTSYGGYGVQATFLQHIDKVCTNCNEKLKLDARLYTEDAITRVLDHDMRDSLRDEGQPANGSIQ